MVGHIAVARLQLRRSPRQISRFAKLREKDRIAGAKTNRFRVKIRHPAISADWQFLVCPGQPLNISYPQRPEGHPQTGRVFR
jgi:hypothetical protein